jgi:hypothetical protein
MISDAWVKEFYQLRNMAEDLTHAHPAQTMRTMAGMSMEKRKALCHPYPTLIEKIEKYGYDGKQLSHIIRLTDFMERYAAGESFRECLVPTGKYRDLIMEAKLSKFSLEEALELANEHDRRNREMKDNYIAKYGDVVNTKPYERLDELKTKILKKYFRFEIMRDENDGRIFYEYSNMAIHKHLLKMKINQAIIFLTSGASASKTSKQLGFASQAYFTAAFKRETGLTPREYISKYRN